MMSTGSLSASCIHVQSLSRRISEVPGECSGPQAEPALTRTVTVTEKWHIDSSSSSSDSESVFTGGTQAAASPNQAQWRSATVQCIQPPEARLTFWV
jgi:hypothetical protein